MTKTELGTIQGRLDRLMRLTDEDPSAGSTACALAYSFDVPALIAEVRRLRALYLGEEWEGFA